jgi:hypothetical protein
MPLLLTISGFSLVLIGTVIYAADRLGRMRIKVRVALPLGSAHSSSLSIAPEPGKVVPVPSAQMSLFDQEFQAPPMVAVEPLPPPLPLVLADPAPVIEEPRPDLPQPLIAAEASVDLAPDPSRRARSHTSERLDWAYFNKDLGDLQDPGTPRIQPAPAPRLQLRRPPRTA